MTTLLFSTNLCTMCQVVTVSKVLQNCSALAWTHSHKMNKYSSASSLPSAKLETSFGVTNEEPKTHVVLKPGAPVVSLTYSGMVTPGSISSNTSTSRMGTRSSMMSNRSFDSSKRSGGGSSSRASVRSVGCTSSGSNRYQTQYSHCSDRSQHATSGSSAQGSSVNDDNVFMTSPEYNMSYASHHNSTSSQGPRTCPEQGSYTKVSNSCVNLLNNFVAQSLTQVPPPYMPPLRYDSTVNNTTSKYQLNTTTNSVAHRSSANTSSSSYDTACSHLSNRDSLNLGNGSNTHESAGSLGSGVETRENVRCTSEVRKWPSPPQPLFSRQPSRCSERDESPVFMEPQVPKLQLHSRPPIQALQESYRMAMETDRNMPSFTPVGRSLFGRAVRKSESSPNLQQFMSPPPKNRTLEALQICTLMLPPASRRKLHLLLRLMHKMVNNMELRLDAAMSTRALVLDTFSRCILRSPEEVDFNEILCVQVVAFMMDNYTDLMAVPIDLKARIEDRIIHLRRSKSPTPPVGRVSPLVSAHQSQHITYCEQLSLQAYESNKLSNSQSALADLLDDIVRDRDMSSKEKKKRLKQFQKHYPEIYSKKFPSNQSEAELFPNKPKIKPPLLVRPLHKLRSLRL